MKNVVLLLLGLLPLMIRANMASPVDPGTLVAAPFISSHVDIVREKLLIVPDENFETARFSIEYHLRAQRSGAQIPLLFYAVDFREDFRVWVDGNPVALRPAPSSYQALEGTPFSDFSYFFESNRPDDPPQFEMDESPSTGFMVRMEDLKFFETDLTEGDHIIRVEYVAGRWTDHSDWVNHYSFRYALSPAKYWKSFGELEITLDASRFPHPLTSNLGPPTRGDLSSSATWTFTSLPAALVEVVYQPALSANAKKLLALSPTGLAIIVGLILAAFHLLTIRQFRKARPDKRFSWVMLLGSFVVPFLALAAYLYGFELIDAAIGEHAGRNHGYQFMVLIFYPVLLLVYLGIMWWMDRSLARKFKAG